MTEILDKFNKVSVSLKNVAWLIGGLIAIVIFWITTQSHVNDEEIHLSRKEWLRIEKLEWDLNRLQQQSIKRYNRLKVEVDKIKSKR